MRFLGRRGPNVDRLKAGGDLEGLRAASRYEDVTSDRDGRALDLGSAVRLKAIEALSEFYGEEVVSALANRLSDRSLTVRRAAVRGLREEGSYAAADALLEGLADGWLKSIQGEGLTAVIALDSGQLPERFAVKLVEAEGFPDERCRDILEVLLGRDARGPDAGRATAARIARFLEVDSATQREHAEQVLSWVAPAAVEGLIQQLGQPDSRLSAIRVLGASQDSRAVAPLAELLQHPDIETRRDAARSLGRIKDTAAVEPLLAATRDPDFSVREAALVALDSMGAGAVVFGLAALASPMAGGAFGGPGGPRALRGPDGVLQHLLTGETAGGERPDAGRSGGRVLGLVRSTRRQVSARQRAALQEGVQLRSGLRRAAVRALSGPEQSGSAAIQGGDRPIAKQIEPPAPERPAEAQRDEEPRPAADPTPAGGAGGDNLRGSASDDLVGASAPRWVRARGDDAGSSLVQQARQRVAGKSDAALAESYSVASSSHSGALKQGDSDRAEYWDSLLQATVDEAAGRQEFGRAESGLRHRRPGRRRQLRALAQAVESRRAGTTNRNEEPSGFADLP